MKCARGHYSHFRAKLILYTHPPSCLRTSFRARTPYRYADTHCPTPIFMRIACHGSVHKVAMTSVTMLVGILYGRPTTSLLPTFHACRNQSAVSITTCEQASRRGNSSGRAAFRLAAIYRKRGAAIRPFNMQTDGKLSLASGWDSNTSLGAGILDQLRVYFRLPPTMRGAT